MPPERMLSCIDEVSQKISQPSHNPVDACCQSSVFISAAALAAGAAVAATPAVWAVRYALSAPRGGFLVAYWLALLAAALPAMHAVTVARQLPTILIRKVRCWCALLSGFVLLLGS